MKPRIAVVGSLNVDLIASVERLPRAGETIAANGFMRRFGGKGANQALAAARQGARVSMIGCVGDDADGRAYREHLESEGIDCSGLSVTKRELTGTALIAVDARAENHIVVAPGANGVLTVNPVRAQRAKIAQADVVLTQLETPLSSVLETMRLAVQAKTRIVFTPSPWQADFPWGARLIDYVLVNEHEARILLGRANTHRDVRAKLRDLAVRVLVITRGARPTRCFTEADLFEVPTLPVDPADTVGAGDAFAGTLAAGLAGGTALPEAIVRANCAGALATLKPGAQEALPTATQVERALRGRPARNRQ